MMTGYRKVIIISAIVAIAILAFAYYYFFLTPKAHLILGVPYYGIFSGTTLAGDAESSVAMILRYWGDERLSLEEVQGTFGMIEPGTAKSRSLNDFQEFFTSQGYDTEIKEFKNIGQIARFISAPSEVPLLIYTYRPLSGGAGLLISAVLIGVDPRANALTVHQTDRGNNYTFSARGAIFPFTALAIKPGSGIQSSLRGPDKSVPYPERLGIMDDIDIYEAHGKWSEARLAEKVLASSGEKSPEKVLEVFKKWEEVATLPGFGKLHPAGRVLAYSTQAYYAIEAGNYDIAITILRDKAIPLNHDLNKPYGEWPRDPNMHERSTRPWLFLEKAYTAKGDLENAQAAREERLKILLERGEEPS